MVFEDGMKQEKQQHESRRITGAEMQQCPAHTDYHCLDHEQYEDALRGRAAERRIGAFISNAMGMVLHAGGLCQ